MYDPALHFFCVFSQRSHHNILCLTIRCQTFVPFCTLWSDQPHICTTSHYFAKFSIRHPKPSYRYILYCIIQHVVIQYSLAGHFGHGQLPDYVD